MPTVKTPVSNNLVQNNSLIVSAKRSSNERQGVHSWHPYYAGYSESFVKSVINSSNLHTNSLILDPWHGSGTTSLVAGRKSIKSVGFDTNPVMNLFSQAKNGIIVQEKKQAFKIREKINKNYLSKNYDVSENDPLLDFSSKSLCSCIRNLYSCIKNQEFEQLKFDKEVTSRFENTPSFQNYIQSFFYASLFLTARKLGEYKSASNPTWIKNKDDKPVVKKSKFLLEFNSQFEKMILDLESSSIIPSSKISNLSLNGDSRRLPIKDNSFDAVITSPPYLTRIDYAMSTRPELFIFNDSYDLRSIRELTMGAPVIVNKKLKLNPNWGNSCRKFLDAVYNHESKASRSYYYPNFLQYFNDADYSLREIVRTLKRNGKAFIVVQSSYFKECEIKLGDFYVEILKNFKLPIKTKIIYRESVKGHMAHVNTKSREYKDDKTFYEEVIFIEKEFRT